MLAVLCLVEAGSSPLTRGKLSQPKLLSATGRLIPTHAGKTLRGSRPPAGSRAHPHSHGENSASMRLKATRQGSSPLTWGKRIPAQAQRAGHGFIPAHAGKTCGGLSVRAWRGAHPRSRGENPGDGGVVGHEGGSSPLTRGKHEAVKVGELLGGFIPAHAGKTTGLPSTVALTRAHPRSRGENNIRADLRVSPEGSSPLTRGKRRTGSSMSEARRLIPAHAGKTRARR